METIDKIEQSHDRVAVVVNDKDNVIGVISQGDIIRALGSGKNIYSKIDGIIRSGFYYLNDKNLSKAYELFKKRKITLLPIVNEDFVLVDIITLDDIYNFLESKKNE